MALSPQNNDFFIFYTGKLSGLTGMILVGCDGTDKSPFDCTDSLQSIFSLFQ